MVIQWVRDFVCTRYNQIKAHLHYEKGGTDRIIIVTGTTKNHCLHNKIVDTDRIGLGSVINMIWNGYGSVYTVLREGSVTVGARENRSWF